MEMMSMLLAWSQLVKEKTLPDRTVYFIFPHLDRQYLCKERTGAEGREKKKIQKQQVI